jgi:two-component system, sensor histidine kinase
MNLRPDIGARVLLVAVVPVTLIAAALSWYFTSTRIDELEQALRDRGLAVARQVARSSEFGIFSGNHQALRQLADSAVREGGVNGVTIVDVNGEPLVQSGTPIQRAGTLPLVNVASMLHSTPDAMQFYAPIVAEQLPAEETFGLEFARTTQPEQVLRGAVLTQISRAPLEARQRELVRNALLITLAGLTVAVLLVVHLSRAVTRPVLDLAQAVARIGRGDLRARVKADDTGALGVLERGINDMAASLDAARQHLEARIAQATSELQRQKEEAERANRVKTEFLAAASHDLRQPLQALGLFVTTLRLRARDPELHPAIARIERALDSLESVLEALLDISKLDAGVVMPRVEEFPVNSVLARVRDTFAASAAERDLKLAVLPTKAWCRSDPGLLERVVANLVSNALRYTKRGGVVVGCRTNRGGLRIEVWDSGIGIPAERQADIFREFVQVGAPAVASDKGLGLGLAIVDRLCRLLDHPITLRSVPGRGTVFSLQVPRSTSPHQAQLPTAAPEMARWARIERRRVLVIDDDAEILSALGDFLRLRGALPMLANTLDDARGLLRSLVDPPDAIVSDYRLGEGANGIQVIAALRAEFGAAIPAVVLTGDTGPDVVTAVSAAQLPILHKPVRPEALDAVLDRLLIPSSDYDGT